MLTLSAFVFLHWMADERYLSGLRAVRNKAQLAGYKGEIYRTGIKSETVAGDLRQIIIKSIPLPSS